ncbi:hypothetical protein [Staphylococcus equorum]|uniref:Uncharacterized protein n=1 Tax=Staphylococcus equorum TaxID=246432 RepID=A0AAP7IF55_9STAP|nr:hypothetical protein [Staphylococcus equorum]OEK58945.1 hypothetical protein ASS94_01060 [Staphylococcus equorum]
MGQRFKITMNTETDNAEIIELREEIRDILATPNGLLSQDKKDEYNEAFIAKSEKLDELYTKEELKC